MKLNKLLEKQLKKYFPDQLYEQEAVQQFIKSVNESYNAYEKDIELSEHAFKITEEEYREVNDKLKQEIELKGALIHKLKEAVVEIAEGAIMDGAADDEHEILNIASYLKTQIIKRKEADKKIQEQKAFYELILNQIPADIAVFDNQHRYLFVNPLGIKDPELRKWIIGKDDVEYCAYKNRSQSIAAERQRIFNETVQSGRQREWEEKSVDAQGNSVYNLRKMYPVFDADGNLEIVIGYGINITAVKRIEEQIRLSESRYRGIFDNSLALICTHDLNGMIMDLNRASIDTFKFPREQLLGSSLRDLMPAERRADFDDVYMAQIREKGKAEGIMVALDKDGKKIYLLYHNYLVTNEGEQPYVIGFSQDITGRFDAERALKKSEEKYRNIIANMNLGLLEVDANEHIIYANNSFCDMCGYELEELLGKNASAIFWNEEELIANEEVVRRRKQGASDAYEIKTRNKNGEQKWWLISGAPSFDNKGNFVGSIGIHLDITLQKTLEYELRKAKSDAELSAQAKEVFLANMSHEIRTPMNAILGIGRLLEKTHLGTQQKFYLQTIHNAASNLLVIINDLLDFSKIEAGKLTLEHIGFDLNALMRNAIQILNHKAEEKGLLFKHTCSKEINGILIGDPYRINQILMNLLSNSLKFTDSGTVTVACELLSDDATTQLVRFKVMDTGIGMSKDFLANLFDKFSQEDESVTRKYGGTGLGMSISKQLIEMMGGTIDVQSEKNQGTTISFDIQFRKGTAADIEQMAPDIIDTQILKGKRILLVEDNDMNRLLANTILTQYGAGVTEAANGSVAIELIGAQIFDLVLMDVQMPVKDGIETTKQIRMELDSSIPIIALTANAYKKEAERCLNAGMNDFISKPFEEKALVQMVATWLGRTAPQGGDPEEPAMMAEEQPELLYNLEKLEAISRNNDDFVEKMLAMFCESMPDLVLQLQEAAEQNDWKKVAALAHRMKPSLHTMGIKVLAEDVLLLEDLKHKSNDVAIVRNSIAHVAAIIKKVVQQLAARKIN